MSVDIDWSLLSSTTSGESLAHSLLEALNKQLETAPRPSFLGPIQVTEFDFGSIGPNVEIRDIGDVWRAFEENDAESEAGYDEDHPAPHTTGPDGPIADSYDGFDDGWGDHDDENTSVLSGLLSPRATMTRVGGAGIGIGAGMGINLAGHHHGAFHTALNPSHHSHSRSHSLIGGAGKGGRPFRRRDSGLRYYKSPYEDDVNGMSGGTGGKPLPHTPLTTTTPHQYFGQQPPLPDPLLEPPEPQPMPSLQLQVHVDHRPNTCITLMTTLQINYPSPVFMTLPLKLRITGFALSADLILAFNGPKKRVHVCIVDDHDLPPNNAVLSPSPSYAQSLNNPLTSSTTISPESSYPSTPGPGYAQAKDYTQANHSSTGPLNTSGQLNGSGGGSGAHGYQTRYEPRSFISEAPKPIGHRLLPSLQIESEIGRADVHALRNVGKVETFILNLVRKTLVDELVYPSYHTIAL